MPEIIGLLADRGMPEKHVTRLLPALREAARDHKSGEPATIEFRVGTLPMDEHASVRLADSARGIMDKHGWDRMVYITDLPVTTRRPIISQTVAQGRATMLCLPAFGLLRAGEGLRQEMTRLVRGHQAGAGTLEHNIEVEDIEGGDAEADATRVIDGRGRTIRLLLGMISGNRPIKLLRVLSGCLATGVATGGFGIFYGSVWEMSYMIANWRLVLITVLSIVALTFWLIFHNGLWNAVRHKADDVSAAAWRAKMDNWATLATVLMAAAGVYIIIFLVMFITSVTVVPTGFFSTRVHADINVMDYITLAWFSASLGTLGGALGSSFDTDDSIREATYNRRELRRRQIADLFDGDQ